MELHCWKVAEVSAVPALEKPPALSDSGQCQLPSLLLLQSNQAAEQVQVAATSAAVALSPNHGQGLSADGTHEVSQAEQQL
jgi:hypothetical protein